jgi:hypothetical protein
VGLGKHAEPGHTCPGGWVRVDWSGPDSKSPEMRPGDFVLGCPVKHHDAALQSAIYELIRWESEFGGLQGMSGRAVASLPARLVDLYLAVIATRDRLTAERDHAQAKAHRQG